MGKVLDIVNENVVPVIEAAGYEVVETSYVKELGEMHLCFYIYKKGGITLDDCEKVSGIIDPILDELNPTGDESYVLDVSSPGLDRPIKSDRDYIRAMGEKVEVKLYSAIGGKKVFVGELADKTDTEIVLKTKQGEKRLERKNVSLVKPYISFTSLNDLEGEHKNEQ